MNKLKFFLGANSPYGFTSYFDNVLNKKERNYLIKGGPGTGKSTFMKNLSTLYPAEEIYCSSDLNSLDGLIFQDKNAFICDATAPHVLEPIYPGSRDEIVNFTIAFDHNKLIHNKEAIKTLTDKNKELHLRATKYLTAVGTLTNQSLRIASILYDDEKQNRAVKKLINDNIPKKDCDGAEKIRLLSAVTASGVSFFDDTLRNMADKIIRIEDEYGYCAKTALLEIRKAALLRGHTIYTCYCSLAPFSKIEHIIIPELSIAFVTSNRFHRFTGEVYKNINSLRFYNNEVLKSNKQKLNFSKNTIKTLIAETAKTIYEAKQIHDLLEEFYIEAVDYSKIDKLLSKFEDTFNQL